MKRIAREKNLKIQYISNVWNLVKQFKDYITDNGYVLVLWKQIGNNDIIDNQSINAGAMASGAEGYLMVPKSEETNAKNAGLSIKLDYRETTKEQAFHSHKSKLNKNAIFHHNPRLATLLDYAIATKSPCLYFFGKQILGKNGETGEAAINSYISFADEVYGFANNNIGVFGWETSFPLSSLTQNAINGLFLLTTPTTFHFFRLMKKVG